MKGQIQKLNATCEKYSDHDFVHATLLGVAGIFAIIAFTGQMTIPLA